MLYIHIAVTLLLLANCLDCNKAVIVECDYASLTKPPQNHLDSQSTCNSLRETNFELALKVVRSHQCIPLSTLNLTGAQFIGDVYSNVLSIVESTLGSQYCRNELRLILDGTNLGDEGAAAVAAALSHRPPRTTRPLWFGATLQMRNASIGSQGAFLLAAVLANITGIALLALDDNPIGLQGAIAIVAALKRGAVSYPGMDISYFGVSGNEAGDLRPTPLNESNVFLEKYYSEGPINETAFFGDYYQRFLDIELQPMGDCSMQSPSMCQWPSCRLLWATKLSRTTSLTDCQNVRKRMIVGGVSLKNRDRGLAGFLAFLETDAVGIMAREVWRQNPPFTGRSGDPFPFTKYTLNNPRHWRNTIGCNPSRQKETNGITMHFTRVPKTGSSALERVLSSGKYPCLTSKIKFLDHGDGCEHLGRCNGSCLSRATPNFMVLREPGQRFLSIVGHMQMSTPELVPSNKMDFGGVPWETSVRTLVDFLWRGFDCLNASDPHCLVRFINSQSAVLGRHRVILYPQSFFSNEQTKVICFRDKKDDILPRLFRIFANTTSCPISEYLGNPDEATIGHFFNHRQHSEELSQRMCQQIQAIYSSDFAMWNKICRSNSVET